MSSQHSSQWQGTRPCGRLLARSRCCGLALGGGWSVCQLDRQKGLPNKVLAREYKLALPDEKTLAQELEMAQKRIANRQK